MYKKNIFRALGFCVILWGVGVVAVNNQGFASCVPDTGFTGFVMKALAAPAGACAVSARTCSAPNAACTISSSLSPGSAKSGTCKQSIAGCVCKPN